MEAAVLLGVLGVGYLFNKDADNRDKSSVNLPLETDAYKSNYFDESDNEYKKKIFENYNKSKIPGSNIVNYQNIDKYINKSTVDSTDDKDYIYSSVSGGKILKTELRNMSLLGKV